jgi:hypothetical protein
MELRNSRYRVHSLAGRCDHCPAVGAALRVIKGRHLDVTRVELAWLYKKAFGQAPNEVLDDAGICASIQMLKGFAWAVQEIESKRNQVNVKHPTEGGNTQ